MKIGEENKKDMGKTVGYAFGWYGEYSLAAISLEDVDYGDDNRDGDYDEWWIVTDRSSYEDVIKTSIRENILVDVFQDSVMRDIFLCYLKYYLLTENVDENYRKRLEEWYLSENPKYKVVK